jgi:Pyridoxamine 5'-phosphate oxidase
MNSHPPAQIDRRFSAPDGRPTPWPEAAKVLEQAELYWITTVRADGRPHVTPLIGLFYDGAMHFCTGLREQKARNLEHNPKVALTTGNNTLQRIADAFEAKYGSVWHFDVGDGVFLSSGGDAAVFRIEPAKVLAFAKEPHGQTTYRLADG